MFDNAGCDGESSHFLIQVVMEFAGNTPAFFFLSSHEFSCQFPDLSITAPQFLFLFLQGFLGQLTIEDVPPILFFACSQCLLEALSLRDVADESQEFAVAGADNPCLGI